MNFKINCFTCNTEMITYSEKTIENLCKKEQNCPQCGATGTIVIDKKLNTVVKTTWSKKQV